MEKHLDSFTFLWIDPWSQFFLKDPIIPIFPRIKTAAKKVLSHKILLL